MKLLRNALATATAAGIAALAPSVAAAHQWRYERPGDYVVGYRPITHYVRRTVLVRERVWRPVYHRSHYRSRGSVYRAPYYVSAYGYDEPRYRHRWAERRDWDDDR
jgi:hypothetical protein